MSEQTIEQKLQSEIVVLKSRILDTQDVAAQAQQESRILQDALSKIAARLGITGDQIQIEDLIAAVPDVADQEDKEDDAE
ncbi:gp57A chaperone for tail fiber formation [Escherichia phage vB_EcoM_VR7]|uniref:Gp57A chaperone for tail fiber formation n=1 Tax=Escherichia phage vB_EcoM_VR7 TaxID=700939 RepID=E5FIJ2_9CAUD|nr:tail fiber chaperone [Escherichia phage vB_EcoM_VR7]ADR32533.1 gp57A chaperone for tail fiber formation [Escherichia phage vB_EcoM_VR7]